MERVARYLFYRFLHECQTIPKATPLVLESRLSLGEQDRYKSRLTRLTRLVPEFRGVRNKSSWTRSHGARERCAARHLPCLLRNEVSAGTLALGLSSSCLMSVWNGVAPPHMRGPIRTQPQVKQLALCGIGRNGSGGFVVVVIDVFFFHPHYI